MNGHILTQDQLPFFVSSVMHRNPGMTLTTCWRPYKYRKGHYALAELRYPNGALFMQGAGPSKESALMALDTRASLH